MSRWRKPGADDLYTPAETAERLADELPTWRLDDGALQRTYATRGWKSTLMVVNAIGHLAETAWHHPELAVSYAAVTVRLSNHAAGGVTDKDFELAQRIEQVVTWRPAAGSALAGESDAHPLA